MRVNPSCLGDWLLYGSFGQVSEHMATRFLGHQVRRAGIPPISPVEVCQDFVEPQLKSRDIDIHVAVLSKQYRRGELEFEE